MFVYVLNCHGQPLMPCHPQKARLLLKKGKAKIVRMVPFTIQLLYGSSGYKQEVSLGIDAGTYHIGVSATTESKVLFEAEAKSRTDIQQVLATRKQFRRARRQRKTRYRKSRFLNRKKSQKWLAPSVQHKVDAHLNTIKLVRKILPVSKTTIEVAQFDIQKIRNPGIEGKDPILNVHHIETRKTGGDSPENLITFCKTCHDLLHRSHQEHKVQHKSNRFRDATQMGIIRWRIYEQVKAWFPQVHLTYGYLTKHVRISHELGKSHLIDARCISGNPKAEPCDTWYLLKLIRRNNRQLHKATIRKGGKRQRNTASKYVHGFRLFDAVRYQGKPCFVFGRRSTGYFDLRTLDGTKVSASANYKKLTIVQKASALLVERRSAFPPVA
jgi:hypothetical protein